MRAQTRKAFFAIVTIASLSGCQVVGPRAVQYGRLNYNEVIARTSKQQTLENLVRVRNEEPTAFMDVTEVDAAVLSSGSLTGGISGLGAGKINSMGQIGSITGAMQYQESPTIRYQPLLGQALISQLSTPISVDSIANLISSGWGPRPVLDFALDRLLPLETSAHRLDALKKIQQLWGHNKLIIGSAKTKQSADEVTNKAANSPIQITSSAPTQQSDSLVLYVNKAALGNEASLWKRLLDYYKGTQDPSMPDNQIVLRTKPGLAPGSMPIIQLRSALGILKQSMLYGTLYFVTTDQFAARKLSGSKPSGYCWTLPKEDESYVSHYVLIIHSPTPPAWSPYAIYHDPMTREYYYIAPDQLDASSRPILSNESDPLSPNNFMLLNLFLTIQATAASPPLTPTISVGGNGA
jgi:hypothetical protein